MSWETQGRQEHGWFGHGTGPGDATDIGGLADRIAWTAHASLMHMPRKEWRNGAATFDAPRVQRLQTAMAAWVGAHPLSRAEFERRLVGLPASDAAIDSLRAAPRPSGPRRRARTSTMPRLIWRVRCRASA